MQQPGRDMINSFYEVWEAIREQHPDVPGVIVYPAPAGRRNVWGHFSGLRWQIQDQQHHEVVLIAEHLNRDAVAIFATLLHEAAHAMNHHRGIQDCSSNQYHNRKFADAAREIGLSVEQVPHRGFACTKILEMTAKKYEDQINKINEVLIYRREFGKARRGLETGQVRHLKAVCGCAPGRIIRLAKSTLNQGAIQCGCCGKAFSLSDALEPQSLN